LIKTANLTGSVSRNAGGLFESVRRLVQSLADTGMDVRALGTEDEHTATDISAWAPVTVQAFRPLGPRQFGYSPGFRHALDEFAPDLVHTHGIWVYSSMATHQYYRRRGAPYIISAHGMLDPWAVRHSHWKKAIARLFYEGAHLRDAACLRALCEDEARAIRACGLKNPIAIIPNGIDLPEVRSQKSEVRSQTSDLWPLASGRKVLLYLGRIHPKKGLVNLLKAWAAVQRTENRGQMAEWVLAIAGWDQGGHEGELKILATELGLSFADVRSQKTEDGGRRAEDGGRRTEVSGRSSVVGRPPSVLFLGPQFGENKSACYRNCDAFILPSVSEGLPMVILEAWANGKPVLMTPECNLPEGFAANAAIRIKPSVESIAQGLQELFRSPPSALRTLGDNGRALVAERFAWPKIASDMKSVYEWVLGSGAKPECVQTKS